MPDRQLVEQNDATPTRKVSAATAGSAIGALIIGIAVWLGAEQPPAGLEGALSTLGAFIFGYFIRERETIHDRVIENLHNMQRISDRDGSTDRLQAADDEQAAHDAADEA